LKTVLPYVEGMLQPETDEFGLEIGAKPIQMTNDSDYFDLLEELWEAKESFIVLEQDVVGTLKDHRRMLKCPKPYCIAPYPGPGDRMLDTGLGFTRFRKEIIETYPDLFLKIRTDKDSEPFRFKDWRRLDVRIFSQLNMAGSPPHLHDPVRHLHEYG
jgi:hypothetical protein